MKIILKRSLLILLILILFPILILISLKLHKEITFNNISRQADILPTYPETNMTASKYRTPIFNFITDAYQTDTIRRTYSFKDTQTLIDINKIMEFYRTYLVKNGWKEIGGDKTQFNFNGHGVRLHIWFYYLPNSWTIEMLPD